MDLDSLGSCDSGPTVSNGFDSVESLLAYTVDKRQRNAEAASPELRKEALLSNTVKRAHRLLFFGIYDISFKINFHFFKYLFVIYYFIDLTYRNPCPLGTQRDLLRRRFRRGRGARSSN